MQCLRLSGRKSVAARARLSLEAQVPFEPGQSCAQWPAWLRMHKDPNARRPRWCPRTTRIGHQRDLSGSRQLTRRKVSGSYIPNVRFGPVRTDVGPDQTFPV